MKVVQGPQTAATGTLTMCDCLERWFDHADRCEQPCISAHGLCNDADCDFRHDPQPEE